jgi:hypothetical protein
VQASAAAMVRKNKLRHGRLTAHAQVDKISATGITGQILLKATSLNDLTRLGSAVEDLRHSRHARSVL